MAFRDKLREIIKVKDTPHHIAFAFALGVFWGISPFFGLHIIGALFTAWLLRLNKFVAFIGACVSNPWTIVPISTFSVWVGAKLLAIKDILPKVDWNAVTFTSVISWLKSLITDLDNFLDLMVDLLPLIKSFFAGSLIVASISSIASYFIIRVLVTRYNKSRNAS